MKFKSGYTYDELQVGDSASFTKTITDSDVHGFCGITGDFNPAHIDEVFMQTSALGQKMKGRIAHGMLTAGLISTVLGMRLPGKGTLYLSQNCTFKLPVKLGDTITATAEVAEKMEKGRVRLTTRCVNQRGELVIDGEAVVMPAKRAEDVE